MAYGMQFADEPPASSPLASLAAAPHDARQASVPPARTMALAPIRHTPDLRYFDEADLGTTVRHDELGDETHIAADLGAAKGPDERMRLVRGMLRIVGFDRLTYLSVKVNALGVVEHLYFLKTYQSTDIAEHYFASGTHEHDPRFAAALSSNTPFVWDLRRLADIWRERGSPAHMRELFERMRERGTGSGVVFGVPIPHTRLRSIVSLDASAEHAGWITDGVLVQALTLGLSIHQRSSAYVRALARHETAAELSALQMRILGFLAAGLSDKEIALRLNTTVHNVDYHLRRLRQKCGVATRTQLAFFAGHLASA